MKYTSTLFLSFFLNSLSAQSGSLDTTFGNHGKVVTPVGSWSQAKAMALQTDGKIVMAGYGYDGSKNNFAVTRYNPNGSLDLNFDNDGKTTTAFGTGGDYATSVAVQNDGKIVVVGYSFDGTKDEIAVSRYNPNGSLDLNFDEDGKVTTIVGSGFDFGNAVAIQSDGKIVVAGSTGNGNFTSVALVRYNSNGSLDTSFDDDGKVVTSFGSFYDNAFALAIQKDGKIIIAGYSHNGLNYDFALARYNANGSPDLSFNDNGRVVTSIGTSHDYANAILIQNDGKILAAGKSQNGSTHKYDFALMRYNSNGSLDTFFDNDGKVITSIGSGNDEAFSAAIQNDGKVLVAGTTMTPGGYTGIALVKYNRDGSLDLNFNGTGKVITSVDSGNVTAYALKLNSNRLFVGGSSYNGRNDDFSLFAYYNDNPALLPLRLLNFSGSLKNTLVSCNWQTVNESNVSLYNIQRSTDEITYNNIGVIYAKGNIAGDSYVFNDPVSNMEAKLSYRLQILDKDGAFSYSSVVTIFPLKHLISIYPNPSSTFINIRGANLQTIYMFDNGGKLVLEKKLANTPYYLLNIAPYPKGLYLLKLKDVQGNVYAEKLLIQ